MFTGLVEEQGVLVASEPRAGDVRWWIEAGPVRADAAIGDSIAVDGCCLTVVALAPCRFAVQAVPETLARTTLADRAPGDAVNLERAIRLDQRLGGHLVQGHVDGVGRVTAMDPEGEGRRIRLDVPPPLRRFVAEKGSLAVDGVSLTVAAVLPEGCEIAYIPHTLEVTTSGGYRVGRRVNLEVDLLARYLERLLEASGREGGVR